MKGITHMMMLGSDEGYGYDSSDIMAVILKWSDKYIKKPSKTFDCDDDDDDDDDDDVTITGTGIVADRTEFAGSFGGH